MLQKLLQQRMFRYLICGAVTAVFNILLIYTIIELFKLTTPVLRNMANVLSTEASLIFSFFVYKIWVLSGGSWKIKEVLWKQIPLYHVSAGAVVTTRSLILFPLLDWLGINYAINTLIGIGLGSIMNYFGCERMVFRTKDKQP